MSPHDAGQAYRSDSDGLCRNANSNALGVRLTQLVPVSRCRVKASKSHAFSQTAVSICGQNVSFCLMLGAGPASAASIICSCYTVTMPHRSVISGDSVNPISLL